MSPPHVVYRPSTSNLHDCIQSLMLNMSTLLLLFPLQCTTAPPAAREVKGKRKRGRQAVEEEEEELQDERATKRGEQQQQEGEEENVCPNGRSEKKTPPGRKVRGHGQAGPRLLEDDPARMKTEGEPAGLLSCSVDLFN